MALAYTEITVALISDYVAGRLDAADARLIERLINSDEGIADAVAAARRVNSRMTLWLVTPKSER